MMPFDTRTSGPRWALLFALSIAGLAFAVDARFGVYAANVADSSAYVAAGDLWRTGDIFRPVPLHLTGRWPGADQSLSPLGFRPALERGTEVAEYPLGFPVLIAATTAVFGDLSAFLVAPAMHGVLVWATFAVGRRVGGALAGLVAAVLIASEPIALLYAVHPMSDVPAAACWVAAWAIGLGPGAGAMAASGLLTTLAVMIRPNLVPLTAVLAIAWLLRDARVRDWSTWRWGDAVVFGLAAGVGPLIVAWSQLLFYGGVTTPGYLGASAFFRVAHAPLNLATYPALFGQVHGWVPLLGAATVAGALVRSRDVCRPGSPAIVWTGLGLAGVNALAYLFYLPYDTVPFLRFFFVAIAVLFMFYGVVVSAAAARLWRWRRLRWLAPIVVLAAVAWPASRRPDLWTVVLAERSIQQRAQQIGLYLDATLPRDAVVLGFFHTGSIAHYTGHNVIRLDLVPSDALDTVVDELRTRGATPVFVVDELLEAPQVRARFSATRYGKLDWPARASATSVPPTSYWLAADRDRHLAGERWVTDVLR